MKSLTRIVLIAMLAFNAPSLFAKEASAEKAVVTNISNSNTLSSKEAEAMLNRLSEIRQMNIKSLNATQKHELRNEVLSIREKLSDPLGGGVYLSAGALILIVILLIILL